MNRTKTFRSGALAVGIAALLTASPAAAAVSPAGVTCRDAIAKDYQKLMKTAIKTISGCHKSRNKGDVTLAAVNCNDLLVGGVINTAVDTKGKYAKTLAKSTAAMDAACGSGLATELAAAPNPGGGDQHYVSCPVTCAGVPDGPGAGATMTTMSQVTTCMGCAAAATAGEVSQNTLGMPDPTMLSKDDQKCVGAIAKGYSKYLLTGLKTGASCQGASDDLGENDTTVCTSDDPKGKVAKSETKAGDGFDKKCAASSGNVANLGGCAVDTLGNLKACTGIEWTDAKDGSFAEIYDMDGLGCPASARTTIFGDCSVNGDTPGSCAVGFQHGTILKVGWTGLAHGVGITDSYTLAGDLSCPGTLKGACGVCTVDGTSTDNPQYQDFLRCVDDPWTECSTAGDLNDPACNGGVGGECTYYLGPPLSISVGGTFTCTLNKINGDISGTTNPDTGETELNANLSAIVFLGGGQTRPCPICRNDTVAQDGVKDGTCLSTGGSPRDGLPCDVQGFDLTFARSDVNAPTSGNSLDCPPAQGGNISGSGLQIQLPLTTATKVKDAEDPCESPNAAKDCFCGVCDGDPSLSCNNNQECVDAAAGTSCQAGGAGEGSPRKPNSCLDGVCSPNPPATDTGLCLTSMPADTSTYCSGPSFANGKGIITCSVDGDCDTFISGSANPDDWTCPDNDCGTCSIFEFQSCFLDPISVTGIPDPVNPELVGTFCLPPSSNTGVNSATGNPGPGTVRTEAFVQLRY